MKGIVKNYGCRNCKFVNINDKEVNNLYICNINEFSGSPINVTTILTSQKMIRLKEFY